MNVIRGVARAGRIAVGGTVTVVGGAYVFDWAETEYWLQHVRAIVCVLSCHSVYAPSLHIFCVRQRAHTRMQTCVPVTMPANPLWARVYVCTHVSA